MAIIPGGQQIRTNSADVDLTNRGNALVKKQNQVYTMNDIIETVNSEGSGGAPYQLYVAWIQKGLASWSVRELYNNTGLTLTWSNPDSQTIHADVAGGSLYDIANDVYGWGTFNSPSIISATDIQLPGVFIQSSQLDVREARIKSDGSGILDETSFSGFLVYRRMVVTDPVIYSN